MEESGPLTLWRLSASLRSLVQALGSCSDSGAPWSSAMPPSLGRGRIATTTDKGLIEGSVCSSNYENTASVMREHKLLSRY